MTHVQRTAAEMSRHRDSDDLQVEWALRLFRYAAFFYLVAWALHTGDHIRRGLGVVTIEVSVLGGVAAVLQVLAVLAAISMRWRWAPLAAVLIGFPDAVGIAAVHFLPHWSAFSDAFPGAQGTGVTGFSWFAASVEVAGALAFGSAGAYADRRLHLRDQHR
jgi:hypothetical protein